MLKLKMGIMHPKNNLHRFRNLVSTQCAVVYMPTTKSLTQCFAPTDDTQVSSNYRKRHITYFHASTQHTIQTYITHLHTSVNQRKQCTKHYSEHFVCMHTHFHAVYKGVYCGSVMIQKSYLLSFCVYRSPTTSLFCAEFVSVP